MIEKQDRPSKLRKAAGLIEEVCATLDTDSRVCEACGTKRQQNWEESKAHGALIGISQKLRRFANEFEKAQEEG